MRDPHVKSLTYVIESAAGFSFDNPPALLFANELGEFRMENGRVIVIPTEHFANGESARKAIDPFFTSWELFVDLTRQPRLIRFKFERAELIDRDPPPRGTNLIAALTEQINVTTHQATIHLAYPNYPPPPANFSATTEVQIIARRWLQFRDGREPLPSMAYFVLNFMESKAGGRHEAANMLRVEYAILKMIGELSSTKGGEKDARKVRKDSQFQSLKPAEQAWLETAIRRIIHRFGEHAAGTQLEQMMMSDLPDL